MRSEVTQGKAALIGALPPEQQLNVSIVLPVRNQADLSALLGRLYDRSSSDYRKFLSVTDFADRFGATAEDYQSVIGFAKGNGLTVTHTFPNRLVVSLSGTVEQVNKAFNVQMNEYQHPTEDRVFYSPDREPSIALNVPVAHIAGLNNFSLPRPMLSNLPQGQALANVTGSGPSGSYLGSDMRAAYYGGTTLDGNGQVVGILEFDGYYQSDVDLTFSNAGQSYGVPVNKVLLDGVTGLPTPDSLGHMDDAEQVLDIVQAIGMAPGLDQVRVYIGSSDVDILSSMASENIAKQLSCSWSWTPDDPDSADVFFQEFAAQGQSFFTASGDSGAFDATVSPYFYPQEDAYVTAVGGTHLVTSGAGGAWQSETAWNSYGWGSGGGISPDGITLPSWQSGVANTLNGGSSTLRNVPDVAMEGDFDNYLCTIGFCFTGGAGTSFAAPRWAGFMALVDQQAVEAGTATNGGLGFINPALYSIGAGANYSNDFHDITSGNNDTENQLTWFSTATGYDLVTGWGSANGQALIDELAGPQQPGFWLLSSSRTVSVNPGGSGTTTLKVTDAGGFTDKVSLAITSTLPSGVTASWGTNPTADASVLTLTADSSAANTTTTVNVTGTSGTSTATTSFSLTVHTPDFALSASPSYVVIGQGASGNSTISVMPEFGFTGNVNLSVSGLPSGVTASWGTNPTSGSSVLTLSVSSSATPGTSTLTITGTSGTVTETTSLTLVIHEPSFTISTQTEVDLGQGTSGTAYLFINPQYGFNGNVTLSVAGLPSGVTASFSPNPANSNSTLSLTVGSNVATGTYPLTITGTSGSLTASATLTLGVFGPTFTLYSPGSLSVGQGSSATGYVTVNREYGFSGSVTMSVSGLPSGVTALWSPNPTTNSSALTLSATSSAPTGQYTLTIKGTSGSQTVTTTLNLGIYAPTFTLSGGWNVDIGQGGSATSSVYVNPQYGFSGSVTLSASGLPSGVTATFSPNPSTGYSGITFSAANSTQAGQYTVTITGKSGSLTATSSFALTVHVPTFTLSGWNVDMGQGTSSTTSINIYPQYGFSSNITLSVSGLPTGVTGSFNPNPATSNGYYGSILTLTAGASAPVGTYTVTVTGTSGSQTVTTTFTLGIHAPTFTISTYGNIDVGQGTTSSYSVWINPQYGFAGGVTLSASGLPTGVTATFAPNPTTGSTTMILTADASAAPTTTPAAVTITGVSGGTSVQTTFNLGVHVPTFTLNSWGAVTIGQGSSGTIYAWTYPQYGFTDPITLAVSGLPDGVTASLSPNPVSAGNSSVLTLSVSNSAVIGNYTITITGTSGSQTASTTFTLGIAAESFTLWNYQSYLSINQGASGTSTIQIQPQYGFSGDVSFAATGLPSGVTASFSPNPASSTTTLTLTADGSAASGTSTVTITGTSGSLSASTTLNLTVNASGFTLSNAPAAIYLNPGSSENSTISLMSQNGFSGSVSLSAAGLPAGVTATISPTWTATSSTKSSTVVSFTASNTAAITTSPSVVTITGTSGTIVASTTIQVNVNSAPVATSTTLAVSSGGNAVTTVNAGAKVTLTAAVDAGSTALTVGQVNFCDAAASDCSGSHLIGSAQLTSTGNATFSFIPGMGIHSYQAIFAGTRSNSTSSSDSASLTVNASAASTTTMAQSGSQGNYTLTATVTGNGAVSPSGTVSFLDATDGNFEVGSAKLQHSSTTFTMQALSGMNLSSVPVSIAVGDFNGDGILDVAVGNQFWSSIQGVMILLGNGDGTFTPSASSPINVGGAATFVVTGDFDHNGTTDLAVLTSNGSVVILMGKGDGTFTPNNLSPQAGVNPVAAVVGDFNEDGVQDIAVVNGWNSPMTILLGNGDGTFTPSSQNPQIAGGANMIVAADFNGDGVLDLAASNSFSGSISILLGNGDGTFSAATSASIPYSANSIAVGDFNRDGKADLAVVAWSSIQILLGNGDGTFAAKTGPTTNFDSQSIQALDFNGDGITDLATANGNSNQVIVWLGNGDGTFTSSASVPLANPPLFIAAGDFTGDGIPDLAAISYGNGNDVLTVLASQLAQSATASASGLSPLGQGTHNVDASYAGDTSYAASVSATVPLTAQSGPPLVTVTPLASSITTAQPLQVTIQVSGGSANPTPTGSVTLSSGSYSSGAISLNSGGASINIPGGILSAGSDTLTATYAPDSAASGMYTQATGLGSVVVVAVGPSVPTVEVTPSAASITDLQSVTVAVALTAVNGQPIPTGMVSLSSGSYSAQQTLSNGSVSFTVPAGALGTGANTLTAAYSGDSNYAGVTKTTVVTVAVVVIAPPTPPAPVTPGSSATATVSFTAGSSYSGTMSLTCALTASPAGAQSVPSCTLNPTTLTLSSAGTGTTTITVKTTSASSASLARPLSWVLSGGSALGLLFMIGIPSRHRRWSWMLLLLFVAIIAGASGCGGGGSSGSSPSQPTQPSTSATTPGNYTFAITGTDTGNAKITASTSVSITVQ